MSNHEENRPLTRREIRMREMGLDTSQNEQSEQTPAAGTESQPSIEQPVAEQRQSDQSKVARQSEEQPPVEQFADEFDARDSQQPRRTVAPDLSYLQEAQKKASQNWNLAEEDAQTLLKRRREESVFKQAPTPARPRLKNDSFFNDDDFIVSEPTSDYVKPVVARKKQELVDNSPATEPFSLQDLREAESAQQDAVLKPKVTKDYSDEDVDTVSIPAHHLRQASQAAAKAEKALKEALQDQNESYSYPDIKPIDARRSIFDDEKPSAGLPSAGASTPIIEVPVEPIRQDPEPRTESMMSDFDSVLERAIADENEIGSSNNTSALILPMMPDLDMSGPLGGTGEIYVTGSLELPRSLSETGGHVNQLDKDIEDDSGPLDIFSGYDTAGFDSKPKSAMQAVSSKSFTNHQPTTPITKDDNKKPLVFALVGGGLLLAIVVAGVIMFSTGLLG